MSALSNIRRPQENCYWVHPGRLLASEYPGDKTETAARERLVWYLDAGITFFLDLTFEGELVPYADWLAQLAAERGVDATYRRFAIKDMDVPQHRREMRAILDTIDDALAGGQAVVVHCWGGIGRTGTVVGCHLVRHGLSGDEALEQIARWWQTVPKHHRQPHSPETEEQVDYIRRWSEPGRTSP